MIQAGILIFIWDLSKFDIQTTLLYLASSSNHLSKSISRIYKKKLKNRKYRSQHRPKSSSNTQVNWCEMIFEHMSNICQRLIPKLHSVNSYHHHKPRSKNIQKSIKIEFGQIIDMDSKLYRYQKKMQNDVCTCLKHLSTPGIQTPLRYLVSPSQNSKYTFFF